MQLFLMWMLVTLLAFPATAVARDKKGTKAKQGSGIEQESRTLDDEERRLTEELLEITRRKETLIQRKLDLLKAKRVAPVESIPVAQPAPAPTVNTQEPIVDVAKVKKEIQKKEKIVKKQVQVEEEVSDSRAKPVDMSSAPRVITSVKERSAKSKKPPKKAKKAIKKEVKEIKEMKEVKGKEEIPEGWEEPAALPKKVGSPRRNKDRGKTVAPPLERQEQKKSPENESPKNPETVGTKKSDLPEGWDEPEALPKGSVTLEDWGKKKPVAPAAPAVDPNDRIGSPKLPEEVVTRPEPQPLREDVKPLEGKQTKNTKVKQPKRWE